MADKTRGAGTAPTDSAEVAVLETAELAAGLLAIGTALVSWLFGLRLAFTTHLVYGPVYYFDTIAQQDHHLERTDLGAGLAVVTLGTLIAALAVVVYMTIHAQLKPRLWALRQAERAERARILQDGL